MASDPKKRDDGNTGLQLENRPKLEKARRFQVVFHNDDYTMKWFVVDVLSRFFHMSEASATAFMLIVHTHGSGVAGVYSRDVAETKVAEVHEYAHEYGMPLHLTIEPAEDDGDKE